MRIQKNMITDIFKENIPGYRTIFKYLLMFHLYKIF